MNTGIYKIENLINGKVYVGSAVNFKARVNLHIHRLRLKKHHSCKLQNSWNKYGEENFKFEIIELCEKDKLIEREQYYIDLYDSFNKGYNCNPKAGSNIGKKLTDEQKQKISQSKKGKPSNRIGSKHSEESKLKMSQIRKGKRWNPNFKKHTEDTKKKLSQIGASKIGRMSSRYDSTPINQYDLNNKFIKKWKDRIELKDSGYRVADISANCRGLQKSAFGYIWKFDK